MIKINTQIIMPDWVEIRVTDNGPGIPQELQKKLFGPFFTTKPTGKSTGLGLSISYQIIVEKHHKHIIFCSAPESETRFKMKMLIQQNLG